MFQITPELLISCLIGAVVFHGLWLAFSMRFPSMYVLAAAFLLLSPFSLSPDVPMVGALKLGRIYVTIMLALMGFFAFRRNPQGLATKAFLLFAVYFLLGALWSDHPVPGLEYKGLFALISFAGLMMGAQIRRFEDVRRGLRMLFISSAIWAILIGLDLVQHPEAVGRLKSYTLNPNGIASVSQFEVIICLFLALYETSKTLRVFAYIVLVMQGLIIVYTGSRGPMAAAVIGCFILLVPVVRRPAKLIAFAILTGMTGIGVSYFARGDTVERLYSWENTRGDVWTFAMSQFSRSPIWGVGWVYDDQVNPGEVAGANLHSIYITVLCELGVIGAIAFAVVLFLICQKAFKTYRLAARHHQQPIASFCCAVLFSTLIGAGAESGTLAGTTINALMLTLAIGLVDSIPRILAEQGEEPLPQLDEDLLDDEFDPYYVIPYA